MRWMLLAPINLVALLGLSVPIAVHLLLRRRARTVTFPSLRFIPASTAAAVRARAITDWGLLGVRCALIAVAAVALARPLLVTPARRAAWNARVVRAIVVDTSPSIGRDAAAADTVAAEERRGAFRSRVIPSRDLEAGIQEAVEWLETAPPAQRMLTVLSDFQRGALDRVTLDTVPAAVGIVLRKVPVARRNSEPRAPLIGVEVRCPEGDRRFAQAALEATGQIEATVSANRAPRPAIHQRAVLVFTRGSAPDVAPGPLRAQWMAPIAAALVEDPELTNEMRRLDAARPRVGALDGRTMTVSLDAPASSFLLPLTIRAIRRAALAPVAWGEQEQTALGADTLAAWSRAPAPGAVADLAHADEHDARWMWLAVLGLLGIETIVRRRLDQRDATASHERTRAA